MCILDISHKSKVEIIPLKTVVDAKRVPNIIMWPTNELACSLVILLTHNKEQNLFKLNIYSYWSCSCHYSCSSSAKSKLMPNLLRQQPLATYFSTNTGPDGPVRYPSIRGSDTESRGALSHKTDFFNLPALEGILASDSLGNHH